MAQDVQFTKIKQGRIYQAVVEQLQYLIVARKLQPGDQLLPERELAKQFGISRTAVRDAIKVLGEKGLVEARPGSGTFVVQRVSNTVAESMGLLLQIEDRPFKSLQEARKILEVQVVGLAAERSTKADLEKIKQALDQMQIISDRASPHYIDDFLGFTEADQAFHLAIAKATHNVILPVLLTAVTDLTQKARRMIMVVPKAPARILEHHYAVFEAIEKGSRERACEAMEQHMEQITQDLETALSQSNLAEMNSST